MDEMLIQIHSLESEGVLGPEEYMNSSVPVYSRWQVIDKTRLPEWLQTNYNNWFEIRYFYDV